MTHDYDAQVLALSLEKALALACYGESVAAYRYRTLAEKSTQADHSKTFQEMAEEEQGHHQQMRELLQSEYPGSDFVLSNEDKALVTVGQRMIEVTNPDSFRRAIELLQESERQTGRFYATCCRLTLRDDLQSLLKEMSDECFEHAQRLSSILPMD